MIFGTIIVFAGILFLGKVWGKIRPMIEIEKDDITYGIQCKRYGGKVGNHAVQEALSGASYYHCMVAVVLTNNYFTPAAIETAQKTNVLLWDRDKLKILLDKMR